MTIILCWNAACSVSRMDAAAAAASGRMETADSGSVETSPLFNMEHFPRSGKTNSLSAG